jgi:hypothetical protein
MIKLRQVGRDIGDSQGLRQAEEALRKEVYPAIGSLRAAWNDLARNTKVITVPGPATTFDATGATVVLLGDHEPTAEPSDVDDFNISTITGGRDGQEVIVIGGDDTWLIHGGFSADTLWLHGRTNRKFGTASNTARLVYIEVDQLWYEV